MPTRTLQSKPTFTPQQQRVAAQPAIQQPSGSLSILHSPASSVARQSAVLQLQRTLGNAHVARMIQRNYAVPPNLECSEVVPWLDGNSPYAPEWAETRSTFTFVGKATVKSTQLPDGTFEVTIKGNPKLKVKVKSPIDRPTWKPSKRPNRAAVVKAWQNMRSVLDAHENEHRTISEQERVKAEAAWQGIDITATGATKEEAKQQAIADLQAQQLAWQEAAQAEQDKIDPFRGAILECPDQSEETE